MGRDQLPDEDMIFENMPKRTRPYNNGQRKRARDFLKQFEGNPDEINDEDIDELDEFAELTDD